MRTGILTAVFVILTGLFNAASAQQSVWVQIEAYPNINEAKQRAQSYEAALQDVNGYSLGSGWYAIALGPFSPTDATDVLRQLRVTRQIPGDSYIVDGRSFRNQFWPAGAVLQSALPVVPQISTETAPEIEAAVPVIAADETRAEARRAEAQLSREERMLLQTALKWEGFYTAAIDGAIGPGTRNSMADWQSRENYETTGVLTTRQRRELVGSYQEVLSSIGMQLMINSETGIELEMPMSMLEFDRYEPPFAHFKSKNDSGATALLISQTGDEATLRGLFDIMQTLEIVPLTGYRKIEKNSFVLMGQNDKIASYTYAALSGGQVKGFTLILPAGNVRRRELIVNTMRNSFKPFSDAVLPDVYGDPNAAQAVDLLAGLSIRQADMARTGFYVDGAGAVLTTIEAVESCGRITLDEEFDVRLAASDAESGLALLQPAQALQPIGFAQFLPSVPRLNSEIAVSGYSYEGLLGAPTLTYGKLADLNGLNGEPTVKRLAMSTAPGDAGGPVFDGSGSVLGMLLPEMLNGGRVLPEGVNFAADTVAIVAFLSANGVAAAASELSGSIAPEDLTLRAADMTVLVSCWN
ncbi:MAG: trypsin-like peptidase domain-containing protein [Paracoccaceae bacterium]